MRVSLLSLIRPVLLNGFLHFSPSALAFTIIFLVLSFSHSFNLLSVALFLVFLLASRTILPRTLAQTLTLAQTILPNPCVKPNLYPNTDLYRNKVLSQYSAFSVYLFIGIISFVFFIH